jgi:fatty acid desaturase
MSAESHPHDYVGSVPDRLPAATVRALSQLSPARALLAVASEWLGIAAGVALYLWKPGFITFVIALVWIGARQHALTVIAHDASHFRFLRRRWANDLFGNLLLAWPVFISVAGFRKFHGAHHKHFNQSEDGNRVLWRTHTPEGELRSEWVYPKTRAELILLLLRHGMFATGLRWVLRGLLSVFMGIEPRWTRIVRVGFYVGVAVTLSMLGVWRELVLLWLAPLCTWHVVAQYMRLIAEHSLVRSDDPDFQGTRTTIATPLERLLILPRNIGYHIEHHWYPSVPFYRLPELHATLMATPRFAAQADVSRSLFASLAAVTRGSH